MGHPVLEVSDILEFGVEVKKMPISRRSLADKLPELAVDSLVKLNIAIP
jgi:hypothetical protein